MRRDPFSKAISTKKRILSEIHDDLKVDFVLAMACSALPLSSQNTRPCYQKKNESVIFLSDSKKRDSRSPCRTGIVLIVAFSVKSEISVFFAASSLNNSMVSSSESMDVHGEGEGRQMVNHVRVKKVRITNDSLFLKADTKKPSVLELDQLLDPRARKMFACVKCGAVRCRVYNSFSNPRPGVAACLLAHNFVHFFGIGQKGLAARWFLQFYTGVQLLKINNQNRHEMGHQNSACAQQFQRTKTNSQQRRCDLQTTCI